MRAPAGLFDRARLLGPRPHRSSISSAALLPRARGTSIEQHALFAPDRAARSRDTSSPSPREMDRSRSTRFRSEAHPRRSHTTSFSRLPEARRTTARRSPILAEARAELSPDLAEPSFGSPTSRFVFGEPHRPSPNLALGDHGAPRRLEELVNEHRDPLHRVTKVPARSLASPEGVLRSPRCVFERLCQANCRR